MDIEGGGGRLWGLCRFFVICSLATLLGLHIYSSVIKPANDNFDGDFTDIKYVVMQLTKGLSEVTDFALESAGARIMDTGDTIEHVLYESSVGYMLHALAAVMCRGHECLNARAMLRPGTLPGECWAFKGNKGEATIRLLGTIYVSGISLEHIPAHISPTKDIASAPRAFRLEGLQFRTDEYPHVFGTFEYNKDGRPIQYFEVQHQTQKGYNLVRVRILSNWGHPTYTCVYRIRIHGDLVEGQSKVVPEDDTSIDTE